MAVNFTIPKVDKFRCEKGKAQSFLWDASTPGLGLRATENGAKAYIVQARLNGRTVRLTIGEPKAWPLPDAQKEARRLIQLVDQGRDPRLIRASEAAQEATERAARDTTGAHAWEAYLKARKPDWRPRTHLDHLKHSATGGEKRKRSKALTLPGALCSILSLPLADINAEAVQAWAKREKKRPTSLALCHRMLKAFLRWCSKQPEYKDIVHADACTLTFPTNAKTDCLQREMLKPWFKEVRKHENIVVAAFLQCLLLTGARREEMLGLRWDDVDFQWKTMHVNDKREEAGRVIPLTPYVESLLAALPRRNKWVFSSPTAKTGRLQDVRKAHEKALNAAGLPHLTLHGLRRSFGTLAEWVDAPVGVVAQIMGHKASALAEKHYRVRPVDLLRVHHAKIEEFICEAADVVIVTAVTKVRAVA